MKFFSIVVRCRKIWIGRPGIHTSGVHRGSLGRRFYTQSIDPLKIRNIGIIAHIDAGKTTTTERMLYYSGLINRIGNIDEGDTVMDYLPAERNRGITITSAAITFNWSDHKINLIDTPGHADFTFEVIRSIRVLDGAVTVLDGVAGVEAQTEKVWKQANEMGIPKIVYVNKMDRAGAGFGRTVKEVVSKLNTNVGIVNVPYFGGKEGTDFLGVVDVIEKKIFLWKENSDGKEIIVKDIDQVPNMAVECIRARTALIEALCEVSEQLVDEFLELGGEDYMAVPAKSIRSALRDATLKRQIVPVLCGASFKNIGVQPLLEAIVDYLPSPQERPAPHAISRFQSSKHKSKSKDLTKQDSKDIVIDSENKQLVCALAFKVTNDPIKGILVFVRVYSGKLQQGSIVLNTTNGQKERITKLLQMQADVHVDVNEISVGNIGVIVGSKEIRTGDTIVAHGTKRDGTNLLSDVEKGLHLHPITVPPPVFFASIEPISLSDQRRMDEALDILLREDPSLQLTYDEDSSQTLISGMGELHLDIARDRLTNDLKANVEMGKIMVSYKETIQTASGSISNNTESDDGSISSVTLSVEPYGEDSPASTVVGYDNNNVSHPRYSPHAILSEHDITEAIKVGLIPTFARGGKISKLPLHSIHVKIESISIPPDATNTKALSTAIRLATEQCLDNIPRNDYNIMEPIMDVRVVLNEEDIGVVVNDISGNRRGHIVSLGNEETAVQMDDRFKELAESIYIPPDETMYLSKHQTRMTSQQSVVHARVPLSKMIGYLNSLRSMTQGRGTYLMDFYRYEPVTADRIPDILDQ